MRFKHAHALNWSAIPYSAHFWVGFAWQHEAMEETVKGEGSSQEDGVLIYWASWLATVFTVGLFSSGM